MGAEGGGGGFAFVVCVLCVGFHFLPPLFVFSPSHNFFFHCLWDGYILVFCVLLRVVVFGLGTWSGGWGGGE